MSHSVTMVLIVACWYKWTKEGTLVLTTEEIDANADL